MNTFYKYFFIKMVFVRNVGMQNRHFESKIGNLWDSFENDECLKHGTVFIYTRFQCLRAARFAVTAAPHKLSSSQICYENLLSTKEKLWGLSFYFCFLQK